ncbi:D-alanyl-D-alanine carboxypeptidase/D-alanyl-D-alanine-endopeptidase [Paludibacter sp.]
MKSRYFTILALFIFLANILAQNSIDKFINQSALKNANISIYVKDLKTGKEVASYRSNNLTVPASTLKVVTTATALEIFGPEYRYETVLSYDGKIDANGVLNGNLYITGCGDPTLGSSKLGDRYFLNKWVDAIKSAGITKINGRIIADESRFDNEGANPKWTWDDIGNYYAPGIYAIAYLDNTLRVTFKSGAVGTKPEIIKTEPEVDGLIIDNNLLSSRITFDSAYFYGSSRSLTRSVRGEIPANKPNFLVMAELPDPGLTLVQNLQNKLVGQKIETAFPPSVLSSVEFSFPAGMPVRTTIYVHKSVPLSEIVKEINEKSNNFYAEQLFKSISLSRDKVATNKRSTDIIASFWKARVLDITQLYQLDGSGLSPANGVSAAFLSEVLTYMYQRSKYKNEFFNSLPIAGKNGTVAGFLKKTALEGKVYAKSGTISKVKSYSGYIIDDRREWVFTIIINNSLGNSWHTLSKIEDFLIEITKN